LQNLQQTQASRKPPPPNFGSVYAFLLPRVVPSDSSSSVFFFFLFFPLFFLFRQGLYGVWVHEAAVLAARVVPAADVERVV
jgi:hypothetical protein